MDIIVNALVLFVVTIRTDDEGTSNGNEKREREAIRALGSVKHSHGAIGSLQNNGDHLDMMEALSGDLRLGPISGARRSSQAPALTCKCSSSSLATSERMVRETSCSTANDATPGETLACRTPASDDKDDKVDLDSQAPSRMARLLYESPPSSATGTDGDFETPPPTPSSAEPAPTLGSVVRRS